MASGDDAETKILNKLDIVIGLLGQIVASKHETQVTKAVALSNAGLSAADIAKICGTTAGTISVALTNAKKKTKRKTKNKNGKQK